MSDSDPERREDAGTRERLEQIRHDYVTFARRTLLALTVMFVVLVASLVASGYLIRENKLRADDVREVVVQVDRQRALATRANCERSNDINRALVGFVIAISESRRAVALAEERFPQHDCRLILSTLDSP